MPAAPSKPSAFFAALGAADERVSEVEQLRTERDHYHASRDAWMMLAVRLARLARDVVPALATQEPPVAVAICSACGSRMELFEGASDDDYRELYDFDAIHDECYGADDDSDDEDDR